MRMTMQKQMNGLWFRLMALEYRMKSKSVTPTLKDACIRTGMNVLDFGCGPGRYTLAAARIVGTKGAIYAVDIHPLAIKMVEKKAKRDGLVNIHTINSDLNTGLASGSIDLALLYDSLHDMENQEAVLHELRRVLKPDGRLSYKDHTLSGECLLALMASSGFCVVNETPGLFTFMKC
jgi:ubiquinone/menaquinone biosynthesis C-methylase UbiE